MENVWDSVKSLLGKSAVKLLCGIVSVAGKVVDYLQDRRKDKAQQQAENEICKAEKKVDDACDKGGIDDLFDAAAELKKAKLKGKQKP